MNVFTHHTIFFCVDESFVFILAIIVLYGVLCGFSYIALCNTFISGSNSTNILRYGALLMTMLKGKSGVGMIFDYSRDYTVVNGV